MLKIKLLVMASVLILVSIVLNGSQRLTISAENDVWQQIAEYKTWTQVTKKPIKVESYLLNAPMG